MTPISWLLVFSVIITLINLIKSDPGLVLPVHHVMTDSSIQAGFTGTFINIKLTVQAIKPRHTLTGIHVNQIMASSSVVTGAGLTLIYFMFTVDSWVKKDTVSENIGNVANCHICLYLFLSLLFWCKALCDTVSMHEKCYKNKVWLTDWLNEIWQIKQGFLDTEQTLRGWREGLKRAAVKSQLHMSSYQEPKNKHFET